MKSKNVINIIRTQAENSFMVITAEMQSEGVIQPSLLTVCSCRGLRKIRTA